MQLFTYRNPHMMAEPGLSWSTLRDYAWVIAGTFPMALMVNWILLPHALVGGGLTGICSLIYFCTQGWFTSLFPEYGGAIPVWLTTFVFNLVLLIIAGFTVGWRFCIRTIVGVAGITFWYRVIPIRSVPIIDDPWVGSIVGGVIFGLALGVVIANNGSSGGTDIVAMIVNHYWDISLGKMMLLCDVLIITSAYFLPVPGHLLVGIEDTSLFQIRRVLCGVCMTISYTMAVDWLMSHFNRSVQFLIYSKHYEEIATAINRQVNRGVTLLDGMGWYSKQPVKVISVLAREQESDLIFQLIHRIDDEAFVSKANVEGVFGSGFDQIKVKGK